MSEALSFKKGKVDSLPSTLENGTVYFTTDTLAGLWIDDNNTRLHIGEDLTGKLEDLSTDSKSTLVEAINELKSDVSDLLYSAISITSLSHNMGIAELGSTVTSVKVSWATNKTPTTLTLNSTSLDTSLTSYTYSGLALTSNTTYTLAVTDERGAIASKSITVTFANGIYYGVGIETTFDNSFINSLTKKLQTNKAYDFTVTPSAQYIYYCLPVRLGTVTFKVGGFEGGFEAPQTVSFTNASGYNENYYVYRSTNMITGPTTVDVT